MTGVNKVILLGNLGKDPEVRNFEGGRKVATFSLATNESYKDKTGNWQTLTEWHNITCWGGLVDKVENRLKKGSLIYLEGKLRTRKWDDKDGNKRYTTEINADVLSQLDAKREDGQGQEQAPAYAETSQAEPVVNASAPDNDLPF